jgi:hypothetical protein
MMNLGIRQLAIAVGIAAIVLASLFSADSGLTWTLFAAFYLSLLSRWRQYTLPWCPAVVALTVVAFAAKGEESAVLCGASIVGSIVCGASIPLANKGPRRRARLFAALSFASLACIVSVGLTFWPLHLAFRASRPAFEDYAKRLQAGYTPAKPERVGLFVIRKAEFRDGRPCLWIDPHPYGYGGFVRNPFGGVNWAAGLLPNIAFNLRSDIPLDADWAYIKED